MYEEFYNLTGRPFQLTPDHKFFFESSVHKKAASYLLYGLSQGEGFIVITGEVGTGKTTLLQHLLSTLDPSQFVAAQIVTSQLSDRDVLRMVASAFGLHATHAEKGELLALIRDFLVRNHLEGKRNLLLVDEAQTLSISALEELRMLSNFQVGDTSPLQSFLIGQPQFRRTLSSPDLDQLRQRVIASCHIGPMNEPETAEYIRHRLRTTGWRSDPDFTHDAMTAIYNHTGGVPRRINTLCSRLLLFGFLEEEHRITGEMVDSVADELRRETEEVPESAGSSTPPPLSVNGGLPGHIAGLTPSATDLATQTALLSQMRDLTAKIELLETRLDRNEKALNRALRLLADDLTR